MNTEELDIYEEILQNGLIKLCTQAGLLTGELLQSPDIEAKWDEYITDYVSDAIKNIEDYPLAALTWSAFLGMGVAWYWDNDWILGANLPYASYYGDEGWDDMDENILYKLCGYEKDSEEARKLIYTLMSCGEATVGLIQHNNIAMDTEEGFYTLVRSFEVMFRIGASITLQKSGYKKVPLKYS